MDPQYTLNAIFISRVSPYFTSRYGETSPEKLL